MMSPDSTRLKAYPFPAKRALYCDLYRAWIAVAIRCSGKEEHRIGELRVAARNGIGGAPATIARIFMAVSPDERIDGLLGRFMSKLCVHHIGARGETQAFPAMQQFDGGIVNVLYEADESCIDELRRLNAARQARVIVVPRCVAGHTGRRPFFHSQHEYGSSLLEADPGVGDLYFPAHWIDYDYTIYDALRPKARQELSVQTLDDIVSTFTDVPYPDFLSLDTQGSELEILQGSPDSVRTAQCIVSEVEFLSLYKEQPLFGDVCKFLTDAGFVFAKFFTIYTGSHFRSPLGLRGEGVPITTDALFLRDPRTVLNGPATQGAKRLALQKLMFFSLVYGFFEHAAWANAIEAESLGRDESEQAGDEAWYRLVLEFTEIRKTFPAIFPLSFMERQRQGEPGKQAFIERAMEQQSATDSSMGRLCQSLRRFGLSHLAELLETRLSSCRQRLGISSR